MTREELKKGKWYKDDEGDFIKFDRFNKSLTVCSAYVFKANYGEYREREFSLSKIRTYEPMTIDEMKKHLPEHEWWTESNELFPIY